MAEATDYANEIAKQENEDALAKVKASGKSELITLTPEQKAAWKKKLVEVHRQMEDRVGKELIQSIYKETGSDASKL
jgi:C4-dicarboxylate-binding protein DctP